MIKALKKFIKNIFTPNQTRAALVTRPPTLMVACGEEMNTASASFTRVRDLSGSISCKCYACMYPERPRKVNMGRWDLGHHGQQQMGDFFFEKHQQMGLVGAPCSRNAWKCRVRVCLVPPCKRKKAINALK